MKGVICAVVDDWRVREKILWGEGQTLSEADKNRTKTRTHTELDRQQNMRDTTYVYSYLTLRGTIATYL